MYRPQHDIDLILDHARSNGITISILPQFKSNNNAAEVCLYSKEITVWVKKRAAKSAIIASLLHELGHLRSFLEDRKLFDHYFEASLLDNPTKADRFVIYTREMLDISRMVEIADSLALGIPRDYLRANRDMDIWQYYYWYMNGKYPDKQQRVAKQNELTERYQLRYPLRGH